MSYDISIGDFEANYTSNVLPLFVALLPGNEEREKGLAGLYGMKGKEAAAYIGEDFTILNEMVAEKGARSVASEFDAPNSWGTTLGATAFLGRVMAACQANPDKEVWVCC